MKWLLPFLISMSCLAGTCPSGVPAGVTNCFFVSKAIGADANTGADEAHAWAHLPGMPSCVSTCSAHTPASGEGFILRGGDTWVSADLGVSWQWTGASGSPIYVGVDKSWFAGASWVRPIFNCGGGICSGTANAMIQIGGGGAGSFVVFDNIEMTNRGLSDDRGYLQTYASNDIIENIYIHGWNHTGETNDSGFAFTSSTCCGGGIANVFHDNVVDGSDTTQDSVVAFFSSTPIAYNNVVRFVSNGFESSGSNWHDNLVGPIVTSFQAAAHQNAMANFGPDNTANILIYNNVIIGSNCSVCGGVEKLTLSGLSGATGNSYGFNNVVFNNAPGNVIDIGFGGTGENWGTWFFFNNTVECGNDASTGTCAASNAGNTGTFNSINNHWVSSTSPAVTIGGGTLNVTTDLLQTVAAANGQGYTSGSTYGFQPTSVSGGTVATGTNEQSLCTAINGIDAAAGAACQSDTRYACTYNTGNHAVSCPNRTALTRPAGAAWDIGAYQFNGAPPLIPHAHAPGMFAYDLSGPTIP